MLASCKRSVLFKVSLITFVKSGRVGQKRVCHTMWPKGDEGEQNWQV